MRDGIVSPLDLTLPESWAETSRTNLEDGLQQGAKTRDFPSFSCSGAFKIGARRTSISNRADVPQSIWDGDMFPRCCMKPSYAVKSLPSLPRWVPGWFICPTASNIMIQTQMISNDTVQVQCVTTCYNNYIPPRGSSSGCGCLIVIGGTDQRNICWTHGAHGAILQTLPPLFAVHSPRCGPGTQRHAAQTSNVEQLQVTWFINFPTFPTKKRLSATINTEFWAYDIINPHIDPIELASSEVCSTPPPKTSLAQGLNGLVPSERAFLWMDKQRFSNWN